MWDGRYRARDLSNDISPSAGISLALEPYHEPHLALSLCPGPGYDNAGIIKVVPVLHLACARSSC